MRSKTVLTVLAGVAGFLLVAAGCSSSSDNPPDAGSDVTGGDQDQPDGSGGDEIGGDLPADLDCIPDGWPCTEPDQCCSRICAGGTCGACTVLGESCSASSECCSGRCEAGPDGEPVCVLGGACAGLGEDCSMAIDCCSFRCVDGTCAEGEPCVTTGGDCTGAADCCSDICTDGSCESSGDGCVPLGELCGGDDSVCCSGHCQDVDGTYRCTQTSVCRGEGDLCDEDGDCCSGLCGADGHCPVLAECQTVGEPCTGFHECCSGVCADPGTGTQVCQFPSGCRSIGEICLEDDDCCGGLCREAGSEGLQRCEKPASPGCLPAGEVCGGSAYGNSYNCCPSGPDGGEALCLPTDIGITRCWGQGTEDECIPDGEPCEFSDECCGGFCLPDDEGNLVCGTQCVEQGGACTTHADCCDDLVCEDGVCTDNPYGCVPVGGPCETGEDCCTGTCIDGTCTVG